MISNRYIEARKQGFLVRIVDSEVQVDGAKSGLDSLQRASNYIHFLQLTTVLPLPLPS